MNSRIQHALLRRLLAPLYILICTTIFYYPAHAQEDPPKPILVTVSTLQYLNFGTFCYGDGSGTSVIIYPDGTRTSTGNILLLSSSFSTALYDVEAIPGTIITIANGPDAILTGSNGGTLTLHIGDSYPPSPFITTGKHTTVTIGGTLIIGVVGANPAGVYGGTFSVNFIQQ
ncbi:MAG: DUF4402 domain-containing protein [Bacteroidia bacterium]|nr:DUF4402 domain-containing protein [Bacteroidia bacterium]